MSNGVNGCGCGPVIASSGTPAPTPPLDANDVIVLPFTEPAGDFTNIGTAGGTFVAGATVIHVAPDGRFGGGISCPASANAYARGVPTVEPASISVWAWMRVNATTASGQIVFGKPTFAAATWSDPFWSAAISLSAGQAPRSFLSAGTPGSLSTLTADARYSLSLGDDHFIGFTFDGTTRILWLDSIPVASDTPGLVIGYGTTGTADWTAGAVWSPSGDVFDGFIYRAGVSNVARPASWWSETYRRGIGTFR